MPADVGAMLALIKELATYEKASGEVSATEASMLADGFGENAIYKALVAEADNQVVGTAIYYFAYSTWKGRMLYLDDFIVTESFRGYGIGKKLFDALGELAKAENANVFRWHVLNWNAPAINFYKKYDASMDGSWLTCKFTKEQIETLF